jgi:hypothetical protein
MERGLSVSLCRRHRQRIALPIRNNPAAQLKRQATSKVERKRLVLPGALRWPSCSMDLSSGKLKAQSAQVPIKTSEAVVRGFIKIRNAARTAAFLWDLPNW